MAAPMTKENAAPARCEEGVGGARLLFSLAPAPCRPRRRILRRDANPDREADRDAARETTGDAVFDAPAPPIPPGSLLGEGGALLAVAAGEAAANAAMAAAAMPAVAPLYAAGLRVRACASARSSSSRSASSSESYAVALRTDVLRACRLLFRSDPPRDPGGEAVGESVWVRVRVRGFLRLRAGEPERPRDGDGVARWLAWLNSRGETSRWLPPGNTGTSPSTLQPSPSAEFLVARGWTVSSRRPEPAVLALLSQASGEGERVPAGCCRGDRDCERERDGTPRSGVMGAPVEPSTAAEATCSTGGRPMAAASPCSLGDGVRRSGAKVRPREPIGGSTLAGVNAERPITMLLVGDGGALRVDAVAGSSRPAAASAAAVAATSAAAASAACRLRLELPPQLRHSIPRPVVDSMLAGAAVSPAAFGAVVVVAAVAGLSHAAAAVFGIDKEACRQRNRQRRVPVAWRVRACRGGGRVGGCGTKCGASAKEERGRGGVASTALSRDVARGVELRARRREGDAGDMAGVETRTRRYGEEGD